MAPSSYRLDTLAATLIARLEAVRRAHVSDPAAAEAAVEAATREVVARVAAECRETLGDEAQARLLEREGPGTFLPRYTALALEQNRDERKLGSGGIVGQVVVRAAGVAVGLAASLLLVRVLHGPWDLVYFLLPPAMVFWPDLLLAVWRRRFAGQLQEVVDDLGKLQDAHEQLAPASDPEPSRPRPREAQ